MDEFKINDLTSDLINKIEKFKSELEVEEIGIVLEVGDGIARVSGLATVKSQELIEFENGAIGIAFNLEAETVGAIVLGDYFSIKEGSIVRKLDRIASIPVGNHFLGRVINPLGEPIDGKGPIKNSGFRPLEKIAPDIYERSDVDTPLQTGIKAIDSMIPIGRGQRELIIGDRQTGKTAIAIDTIINQKDKDVFCIYVAIGQKKSTVAQIIAKLEEKNAMKHTIVIVAGADENASLQYIAPYAGCAMAEEFMETGRDALVIYDDLTKHAWAYRQISLLMRRPPGREAYPGDLFYLHSRLLERSAKLDRKYVLVPSSFEKSRASISDAIDGIVYQGPMAIHDIRAALETHPNKESIKICQVEKTGGSSTALPIIETLLGDVSAYVPTNVISITDGQIYLESGLFNAGIRPAVNVGISVSRVGGAAQSKAMKKIAGGLRLDMAAYHEIASFAQFGSDLDKLTKKQLERGEILQELLKQPQYAPFTAGDEFLSIYAGTHGFLDGIPSKRVSDWEKAFLEFMKIYYPKIGAEIEQKGILTEENEASLQKAIQHFQSTWE
jgi:F-type H+-transporting ATPase subunit alpha